VLQDVSDKLLAQFVACLEQRSGATEEPGPTDQDAGPALAPQGGAPTEAVAAAAEPGDDALDLGATVLPVLVRGYWRQAVAAALGALAVTFVVRRVRSR
jgi:hypothetical protein